MLPEVLEASDIVLRPFTLGDTTDFYDCIKDIEMGQYLEVEERELQREDAEEIISRHVAADNAVRQIWAITIEDKVIGTISINFSKQNRISEIGYSVKKPLWGKGIASKAVNAVVNAAFTSYPQLQRVQANIHPENIGSIKVAESIGMKLEGVLRSYAFIQGIPSDEAIYAIIRDEWRGAI